jgi:hypothetical protein
MKVIIETTEGGEYANQLHIPLTSLSNSLDMLRIILEPQCNALGLLIGQGGSHIWIAKDNGIKSRLILITLD